MFVRVFVSASKSSRFNNISFYAKLKYANGDDEATLLVFDPSVHRNAFKLSQPQVHFTMRCEKAPPSFGGFIIKTALKS